MRACPPPDQRARAKGGTDRTKYGSSHASTRSFYVHHMQQVSKAAVMYDARATRVQIGCLTSTVFNFYTALKFGSIKHFYGPRSARRNFSITYGN